MGLFGEDAYSLRGRIVIAVMIQILLSLFSDTALPIGRRVGKMLIRKYEPRRATAEEVRRYFLQYYCNAPDALFGSIMDKEGYLNAGVAMWLKPDLMLDRPHIQD
jgi:hypothetical protein